MGSVIPAKAGNHGMPRFQMTRSLFPTTGFPSIREWRQGPCTPSFRRRPGYSIARFNYSPGHRLQL